MFASVNSDASNETIRSQWSLLIGKATHQTLFGTEILDTKFISRNKELFRQSAEDVASSSDQALWDDVHVTFGTRAIGKGLSPLLCPRLLDRVLHRVLDIDQVINQAATETTIDRILTVTSPQAFFTHGGCGSTVDAELAELFVSRIISFMSSSTRGLRAVRAVMSRVSPEETSCMTTDSITRCLSAGHTSLCDAIGPRTDPVEIKNMTKIPAVWRHPESVVFIVTTYGFVSLGNAACRVTTVAQAQTILDAVRNTVLPDSTKARIGDSEFANGVFALSMCLMSRLPTVALAVALGERESLSRTSLSKVEADYCRNPSATPGGFDLVVASATSRVAYKNLVRCAGLAAMSHNFDLVLSIMNALKTADMFAVVCRLMEAKQSDENIESIHVAIQALYIAVKEPVALASEDALCVFYYCADGADEEFFVGLELDLLFDLPTFLTRPENIVSAGENLEHWLFVLILDMFEEKTLRIAAACVLDKLAECKDSLVIRAVLLAFNEAVSDGSAFSPDEVAFAAARNHNSTRVFVSCGLGPNGVSSKEMQMLAWAIVNHRDSTAFVLACRDRRLPGDILWASLHSHVQVCFQTTSPKDLQMSIMVKAFKNEFGLGAMFTLEEMATSVVIGCVMPLMTRTIVPMCSEAQMRSIVSSVLGEKNMDKNKKLFVLRGMVCSSSSDLEPKRFFTRDHLDRAQKAVKEWMCRPSNRERLTFAPETLTVCHFGTCEVEEDLKRCCDNAWFCSAAHRALDTIHINNECTVSAKARLWERRKRDKAKAKARAKSRRVKTTAAAAASVVAIPVAITFTTIEPMPKKKAVETRACACGKGHVTSVASSVHASVSAGTTVDVWAKSCWKKTNGGGKMVNVRSVSGYSTVKCGIGGNKFRTLDNVIHK